MFSRFVVLLRRVPRNNAYSKNARRWCSSGGPVTRTEFEALKTSMSNSHMAQAVCGIIFTYCYVELRLWQVEGRGSDLERKVCDVEDKAQKLQRKVRQLTSE